MKAMTFTTARGVPMRVLYLDTGECGAFPAATAGSKPLVEFYDTRYPHTEFGQFTGGRYYAETLTGGGDGAGLALAGRSEEWTVDATTMVKVRGFIRFCAAPPSEDDPEWLEGRAAMLRALAALMEAPDA